MALIFIVVTLFGVAPFGITHFAIHYLFPFCLFAALGLAGLVATRVNAERFASFGIPSVLTPAGRDHTRGGRQASQACL